MAVSVITNSYLLVNAVDLNDHIDSCSLEIDAAQVARTNMSSAGWEEFIAGLKSFKVNVNFHEDFVAAKTEATLWGLIGTTTTFEMRPTSAARSATNPGYTGSLVITQFMPIQGKVGDLSQLGVTWPGTGTLTRNIV